MNKNFLIGFCIGSLLTIFVVFIFAFFINLKSKYHEMNKREIGIYECALKSDDEKVYECEWRSKQ